MKKNFAEIFYKNAGYVVVALISIVYIASSLILIEKTGKSVPEIIGTGVLSMIVGLLINGVFRSLGIRKGDENEKTISTNNLHAKMVDDISPYIDKLDEFCEHETKKALQNVRTKILAREGLKYSDHFDSDGVAKNVRYTIKEGMPRAEAKAIKAKGKAFKRAIRAKIKPLLASNLTSDGVKADNPFDFGKSKKQFTSQKNASDAVIRVLMALIFGYFGVSLTSDINVASLIWNSLQIIMYVCGGVIQMYNSFSWVVDDYRQSVIKKIDILQKFKVYSETKNATAIEKGEKSNGNTDNVQGL